MCSSNNILSAKDTSVRLLYSDDQNDGNITANVHVTVNTRVSLRKYSRYNSKSTLPKKVCSLTTDTVQVCFACRMGKSHKLPFISFDFVYSSPLELLQIIVKGPAPVILSGYRYSVSIVDAFSRFTWIYFLARKSDVANIFASFRIFVEKKLNCTVKAIQSDN